MPLKENPSELTQTSQHNSTIKDSGLEKIEAEREEA